MTNDYGEAGYGEGGYGGPAPPYPGNLLLFAENLYERGLITNTHSPTAPVERLFDRDRGPQFGAAVGVAHGVRVELPYAQPATALAVINHTLVAAEDVVVASSDDGVTFTQRGITVGPQTDPLLLIFGGSTVARFWRVTFAAHLGGTAPQKIGEILLGVPRTLELPFLRNAGVGTLGNVRRDRSPAGYSWTVKRGQKRARLPYGWPGLSDADLATLQAAFDECDQGAKKLLVRDSVGALRWCDWISDGILPVPIGNGMSEVEAVFEEAV